MLSCSTGVDVGVRLLHSLKGDATALVKSVQDFVGGAPASDALREVH